MTIAALSVAFAMEITTPKPSVTCTAQNCIVSFTKMDDEKLDEMINSASTSIERSGILALKFQSCELDSIPMNVFNLFPTLLCLMATTPGLTSIGEDVFVNASSLQFLYLPGNDIAKLGPNSFSGAVNLNEINLSDNEIEVVSESAFESLEHVESISLSGNQIAFFGLKTFSPLAALINLDISGNMLEFLDFRLFANNEKLNGVNIANNQIIALSRGFLQMLPQIKVLNMMNNPCTINTMLENIPFIKITDSTNVDKDDEVSLAKCYLNYDEMTDPESTDLNDLLNEAEIVREDIETNIIAELTDKLREKDIEIETLSRHDDYMKILVGFIFIAGCFFTLVNIIYRIVDKTHNQELATKIKEHKPVIEVNPKQVVYTIEV